MQKAIRENLHYGATWIKIVVNDYRYIYSRRVKIFMRLPDGRNGATRQAVHGTEWRPLDR